MSALVASESGISPDDASQRIDAFERQIQERLARAEQQAREAAEKAAKGAAAAASWVFASMLLGSWQR